jgi:ketosteroid isomerase-like protein
MSDLSTDEVIHRFNESFLQHDPEVLNGLLAEDCVMESVGPAPDGTRYEGRDACLRFWQDLASDPHTSFEPEEVFVAEDRATIRWRVRFGDEAHPVFGDTQVNSVRGVNLMRVRDGQIVEALGYTKTA